MWVWVWVYVIQLDEGDYIVNTGCSIPIYLMGTDCGIWLFLAVNWLLYHRINFFTAQSYHPIMMMMSPRIDPAKGGGGQKASVGLLAA